MAENTGGDMASGSQRLWGGRFEGGPSDAMAALSLAQPTVEAYRKIQLVEPLAKQLKAKKAKMEEALGEQEMPVACRARVTVLERETRRQVRPQQRVQIEAAPDEFGQADASQGFGDGCGGTAGTVPPRSLG